MATVKLDPAKGVQIPNLTTTERNAISSPETGALIWNTTTSAINQYNGSAWEITYTDTNTQVAGITSSANATAITIDSSENVMVTKTSLNDAVAGVELRANGIVVGSAAANVAAVFNRNTSEGDIVSFKYGGSERGTIFTSHGTYIGIGTGTTGLLFNSATRGVLPANPDNAVAGAQLDSTIDLGHSSVKWRDLYLSGGIQFDARSNKLDDYEEGTWTPACSRATISTINRANYTKIGRLVHVFAYLILAADGTGHNIDFTGLPFTTQSNVHETGIAQFSNNSVSRGIMARTDSNSTTIYLIYTDGTQAQVPADTVDGGHVMISLTYNIA